MSVLMEFAIFPTDKGESVSKYVAKIIKMIDKSRVKYRLTPMGTVVETKKLKKALKILNKSYKILKPYSNRVYATVKFDIRKNRKNAIHFKIKSIKEKIK